MTKAIAEARADIEASATALTSSSDDQNRAHRLAALVADLESRLAFLLRAASSAAASDPLAAIKTMTDEERIALST
jgi:hypothetical protein